MEKHSGVPRLRPDAEQLLHKLAAKQTNPYLTEFEIDDDLLRELGYEGDRPLRRLEEAVGLLNVSAHEDNWGGEPPLIRIEGKKLVIGPYFPSC